MHTEVNVKASTLQMGEPGTKLEGCLCTHDNANASHDSMDYVPGISQVKFWLYTTIYPCTHNSSWTRHLSWLC